MEDYSSQSYRLRKQEGKRYKLAVLFLLLLLLSAVDAAVPVDLVFVKPGAIKVASDANSLKVDWPDAAGQVWTAVFSLDPAKPLITSIGTGGKAVIERARPYYKVQTGKRRGGWDAFFDFPPSHPEGTRSFQAEFKLLSVAARSEDQHLIVSFAGLRMGLFEGSIEYVFYPGGRLIAQRATAMTNEPDVAYIFDAGIRMTVEADRRAGNNMDTKVSYFDTAGNFQTVASTGSDFQYTAVRHRAIAAKMANGSVVAFPPPHQYFFARDYTTNMAQAWHSAWRGTVALGVRQLPDDNSPYYPWMNAPPGTLQKMTMFLYVDQRSTREAMDDVLKYTHNDKFVKLDGYKTVAPHWHLAYTVQALEKGFAWEPPFKPVLKAMGVDSAIIMDFHGDGHPADTTDLRLRELDAFYKACRAQSDKDFLLIPSEEANAHLGGHWAVVFPKPVYWFMKRAPGEDIRSTHQEFGKVYRAGSVQEFADDIQRFLDFEPVRARPDTTWYRTRKYARRHWVGLVAAAFSVTALCVGTGVAVYQARQARAQFNDVRQLANKFLFEFHDAIANTPGTVKARELVVSTALDYLNKLSANAAGDPGLQWELATAYAKVAEAQGSTTSPSLSRLADGVSSYDKALALARSLAERRLLSVEREEAFVKMLSLAGQMRRETEDFEGAKRLGREAVERGGRLSPASQRYAINELASTLGRGGDLLGSVELRIKLVPISREIANREPSPQNKGRLMNVLLNLGYFQAKLTRFEEARTNETESLAILRELARAHPQEARLRGDLFNNLYYLGLLEGAGERPSAGNQRAAMQYFAEALQTIEADILADPNDKASRLNAARTHVQLASSSTESSPQEAIAHVQTAISIFEATDAGRPYEWAYARILGANALRNLRRFTEAETMLRAADRLLTLRGSDKEADLEMGWARLEFARGGDFSGHLAKALAIRESDLKQEPVPAVAWDLVQALEFAAIAEPATVAERRERIQAVWSDQNRRYPGSPYLQKLAAKK